MNKSHKFIAILFSFTFLLWLGCFTMNQVGTPTGTTIEFTNADNNKTSQHFSHTKSVNHYLWGLVSPKDAGVEKIVANEVKKYGGKEAVNVKLRYQQTFVNGLLGVITLGIYTPFTLTVEGDIVK